MAKAFFHGRIDNVVAGEAGRRLTHYRLRLVPALHYLHSLHQGGPATAFTLDQLPGKTVKLKIKLAAEEEPHMGDTWVQVPNGWKRCIGKGFEDQHAFCHGNHKDFSTFRMVDERTCTIYPGCTEDKDETP